MSVTTRLSCAAILCGWLALAFGFFAPSCALAADPLAAVVLAQQGIDQADSDLFNQAVDVNSVVSNASDALNAALREQLASGSLAGNAGAMLLLFSASDSDPTQSGLLKQLIVSEVKSFLAAGINGGYFAGKPNDRVSPKRGTLAATIVKMPEGRRVLTPGKVLSQQNGKATVSATFSDPKAGSFPLVLELEQHNEKWRVTKVANAADLLQKASSRER